MTLKLTLSVNTSSRSRHSHHGRRFFFRVLPMWMKEFVCSVTQAEFGRLVPCDNEFPGPHAQESHQESACGLLPSNLRKFL